MYYARILTNYGVVRSFAAKKYKVLCIYSKPQTTRRECKFTPKGLAGNDRKLVNNLSRTRARVFELACCNPWEYFVTLTLDPQKYDRTNLEQYRKDLSQYIRDFRKKSNTNVKYLLVPEQHKDGSWHMHGFLMGLPPSELREFTLSDHLPYAIRNRLTQGKHIYTWEAYAHKFGYTSIERIDNGEAASKYITKYITKDAMRTMTALHAHIFYASKGLKSSEIVAKDILAREIENPDYFNDRVSVKWCNTPTEVTAYFDA